MTRGPAAVVCCGLALAALPAGAAAIATDRPTYSPAASVVPAGRFQVEAGGGGAFGAGASRLALPVALRLGASGTIEVRLSAEALVRSGEALGWGDLVLGAKWLARDGGDQGTTIALLVQAVLPAGRTGLGGGTFGAGVQAVLAKPLPAGFAGWLLAGVPIADLTAPGLAIEYAAGVSRAIDAIDSRLGAFVETAGVVGVGEGAGRWHTVEAGLSWLVSDDLQLDLFVQPGIGGGAPSVQAGFGVGWRR